VSVIYGYARASTDGKSVAGQVSKLKAAGCEKIFKEDSGSEKTGQTQLILAIVKMSVGDVLMVTNLDCLASSTRDLLKILSRINRRKAGFKSLRDSWADTTTSSGHLRMTVIEGVVEFDKKMRGEKVRIGQNLSKEQGGVMGRKSKLTERQKLSALNMLSLGKLTQREIAKKYNVSHSTISRLLKYSH